MMPEKLSLNDFTNYLGQLGLLRTSYPDSYYSSEERVPQLCIKQAEGDDYLDSIKSQTVYLEKDANLFEIDCCINKICPDISYMQYKKLMKKLKSHIFYYNDDPYSEASSVYEEKIIPVEDFYNFLVDEKYLQPSDIDLYHQKEDGLTFEKLMTALNNTMEISKNFSATKHATKYFSVSQTEDGLIHMFPGEFHQKDNSTFFQELKKMGFPVKNLYGEESYALLYFSEPSFSFCSSSLSDAQKNKTNYYSNKPRIFEPKVLYAFILNACSFPFPEIESNDIQRMKKPDTLSL